MATTAQITAGDLFPALTATLSDVNGPVNLVGSTVTFRMVLAGAIQSPVIIASGACTLGETTGQVTYQWQSGDTATVGNFYGQFLVNNGSGTYHFPNTGPIDITINRAI